MGVVGKDYNEEAIAPTPFFFYNPHAHLWVTP